MRQIGASRKPNVNQEKCTDLAVNDNGIERMSTERFHGNESLISPWIRHYVAITNSV